jgi:hypothetical protein
MPRSASILLAVGAAALVSGCSILSGATWRSSLMQPAPTLPRCIQEALADTPGAGDVSYQLDTMISHDAFFRRGEMNVHTVGYKIDGHAGDIQVIDDSQLAYGWSFSNRLLRYPHTDGGRADADVLVPLGERVNDTIARRCEVSEIAEARLRCTNMSCRQFRDGAGS